MNSIDYYRISIFLAFIVLALPLSTLRSQVMDEDAAARENHNILLDISEDQLNDLEWANEPEEYGIQGGELVVVATKGTDFFINPEDMSNTATAPVLFKEITGDFVATACVSPDLSSVWNAAGLLLRINDENWVKFVFENSDATGPSIVTVTTRKISDDANGVRLSDNSKIWLKLSRKGNNYAMHWSEDGTEYKMARLSAMSASDPVKIGLEAQCPVGENATHTFHYFSIESKTVTDLRKGE